MTLGLFFSIFCVLMIIGTPVAVVFGFLSFLPGLLDPSFPYTMEAAVRSMLNGMDSFTLIAVPLFMLSGIIMARGGISEKLFNFFAYFVGDKTAGLPCAAILTCMFYAAISGSSPATVSAVGSMTIPFLIAKGYDKVFVTAIVTVAGGLGVIIPPSISYIVYASIANSSPAELFIGGVFPGLLIGVCLMLCAYLYCRKSGEDKATLRAAYEVLHKKGFWAVFKDSFFALLTPLIILGSIYGGIASPTEAAAISVIYAIIVSFFIYRVVNLKQLGGIIVEGAKTYILILFIIATAISFGKVITILQYPQQISEAIISTVSSKIAIILIINMILIIFGMFVDNIPNLMVLTPILLPVAVAIGMHPTHFGIIITANLAIGMITPPMGINLYVANSMTQIPVLKIAKAAVPFLVAFFIALMIISFVPWLSLKLPGLV